MSDLVHVFRERPTGQADMKERFCRPGAAFGPASLEEQMGVRLVYHEKTTRLPCGKIVCTTCRMVEA